VYAFARGCDFNMVFSNYLLLHIHAYMLYSYAVHRQKRNLSASINDVIGIIVSRVHIQ